MTTFFRRQLTVSGQGKFLKTNFTGLSKYCISVLHSNILILKPVLKLNTIERKESQKIQTNKVKHEIQKGDEPI